MARRLTYSRWDGTQVGFDLDADEVMAQLNDDLLYHGDLNAALRKMLQQGFEDRNGDRVQGLREMLEKLRERREQTLERYDLGGVYDEINQALEQVVEQERRAIEDIVDKAKSSGDERRQETADAMSADRNMQLDFLPPDLAGRVQQLQNYDFVSEEARQQFEELMEQLKNQLMEQQLSRMQKSVSEMTPEDMARMKDMYSELNKMLEAKNNGEDTEQKTPDADESDG